MYTASPQPQAQPQKRVKTQLKKIFFRFIKALQANIRHAMQKILVRARMVGSNWLNNQDPIIICYENCTPDSQFNFPQISKKLINEIGAQENIRQEILIQCRLNHENILKLIETFEDDKNLYMILEYCQGGNLYQYIKKNGTLSEEEAFGFFYQILNGIDYMHKRGIVHRDLKVKKFVFHFVFQPENLLITEDKKLKICDFNWATTLDYDDRTKPVMCGTVTYMPPEVLSEAYHGRPVDIWSLGIVLYSTIKEMLHSKVPFSGKNNREISTRVLRDDLNNINVELSSDCQFLIHAMLAKVVHYRPTSNQIFMSKWVKSHCRINRIESFYQPLSKSSIKLSQSTSDLKPVRVNQMHLMMAVQPFAYKKKTVLSEKDINQIEIKLSQSQKW